MDLKAVATAVGVDLKTFLALGFLYRTGPGKPLVAGVRSKRVSKQKPDLEKEILKEIPGSLKSRFPRQPKESDVTYAGRLLEAISGLKDAGVNPTKARLKLKRV